MPAKTGTPATVRQRGLPGTILQIPMGDWHTYAWILSGPEMALLDARSTESLSPADAVSRPVLFRIAVHKSAYNTGRWLKVGTVPVPGHLSRPSPAFMQDPITGKLSISEDGGVTRRPASPEECRSLERLAVWDPVHVEDRLRDHYAGVPNKWVESLRPRATPR